MKKTRYWNKYTEQLFVNWMARSFQTPRENWNYLATHGLLIRFRKKHMGQK